MFELAPEISHSFNETEWKCYTKTIKQHKDITYWPAGTQRNEERHYDGEIRNVEVTCPEVIEETPRITDKYKNVRKACMRVT